ncbi:glycosyl transferase [Acaryochloris sp. IP29b_bin.148]|uniref:glycosyl transferase n=1 Tax=Acaryochloris sp. IP29b_bin.148 TaxID=2969218 RepID=UPI00260DC2B2|nr:glycosyl transferase [Acaryochloris sp. IP29b_bin.148]
MPQPTLYVAITNHGFGHATRTAAVLAEIQRLVPDILLIVVTSAPRWLIESYISGDFIYRSRVLDVGVVQSDGLSMNIPATLTQLQDIRTYQQRLVATEVDYIKQVGAQLILADIPPLASVIAEAAGIPCWMASNFGWDLIYQQWGEDFAEIVDWVTDCFHKCDRLFRLPFHTPMPAFHNITDVGLTGASPRFTPLELRRQFGIEADPGKTVLLSFGGLGLAKIPYRNLQRFPDWQFITFDRLAPDTFPNLVKVTDTNYRPVDLMPLCGRIISKPGYGTFSEACLLDIPVISIPRSDFAEAQYLLSGLQDHNPHYLLADQEFTESHWEFLFQPLTPPRTEQPLPKDGNLTIARAVMKYLDQA